MPRAPTRLRDRPSWATTVLFAVPPLALVALVVMLAKGAPIAALLGLLLGAAALLALAFFRGPTTLIDPSAGVLRIAGEERPLDQLAAVTVGVRRETYRNRDGRERELVTFPLQLVLTDDPAVARDLHAACPGGAGYRESGRLLELHGPARVAGLAVDVCGGGSLVRSLKRATRLAAQLEVPLVDPFSQHASVRGPEELDRPLAAALAARREHVRRQGEPPPELGLYEERVGPELLEMSWTLSDPRLGGHLYLDGETLRDVKAGRALPLGSLRLAACFGAGLVLVGAKSWRYVFPNATLAKHAAHRIEAHLARVGAGG